MRRLLEIRLILTVIELKYIWNKHPNYEKTTYFYCNYKFKTIYSNGCYLLLFGKRKLESFEI